MHDTLHIHVADLKPEFVRDLEEKFGEAASLEIRVLPRRKEDERLTEDQFWAIIDALDWSAEGDDEAVVAPAVERLAAMPVSFIYQFQDKLSEKLHALDTKAHASHIGEASWAAEKYFSVDEFLYVRCCVVANGREAYETALKDPTQMPEDMDFEPLLYLASDAYERKTGKAFRYAPAVSFETFSNEKGWQ